MSLTGMQPSHDPLEEARLSGYAQANEECALAIEAALRNQRVEITTLLREKAANLRASYSPDEQKYYDAICDTYEDSAFMIEIIGGDLDDTLQ